MMIMIFVMWLIAFVCFSIIKYGAQLIQILTELFGMALFETQHYFSVTRPLQKSGTYEKKELEERMVEEEKRARNDEYVKKQRDKIVQAGLYKVQELRIKYQFADENLFQLYLQKYPIYAVHELNEIENKIRESHISKVG